MADNITEAYQLINQLLAALNSTVGSYTASQESDKEDDIGNQLSSTALVVSFTALVIALLQAILEYVSSNSAQGEKCNTGAIGDYARVSGIRRWSWRHWRRQYFYPELQLDIFHLCRGLYDVTNSGVGDVFKEFNDLHPAGLDNVESSGYSSWRYLQGLEDLKLVPKTTIR
ncbi:hypothetical protein Daus18300_002240 [Diaporthe australafricana]|uniref:Uncharacterized protein n=1 Tax=Diaporthe australafricana TaxID=127596 RepID=A0ABR3XQS3_9PEZI